VGSQINILLCWLSKFGSKDIEDKHDSFVTVTTKIIRKHQKIINFSENVENLYTYIALLHFTLNIVMICSLAFLIVTVSKVIYISNIKNTHLTIESIALVNFLYSSCISLLHIHYYTTLFNLL